MCNNNKKKKKKKKKKMMMMMKVKNPIFQIKQEEDVHNNNKIRLIIVFNNKMIR